MPSPTEPRIISPHEQWVSADNPAQTLETFRSILRPTDRKFIKVFPIFLEDLLAAMRNKKLAGAEGLLLYLMSCVMDLPVNAMGKNLGIHIAIKDVAQATGKKERAIKKNLRTLLDLGFLIQPTPRIPIYILPPDYIYRGVLRKLHKATIEAAMQMRGVSATKTLAQIKSKRLGIVSFYWNTPLPPAS
jgi:hypothetical protein